VSETDRLLVELGQTIAQRDEAVRERDNIEARIVSILDAAFTGPVDPCGDMSAEVARLVRAVRIRERMLATAISETNTARQEAARAEAERDKLSAELERMRINVAVAFR
jgi:hypothetical protein